MAEEGNHFTMNSLSVEETTISIKSTDGYVENKYEITCEYYVSVAGKNAFLRSLCDDGPICRGFCKENKKIINLAPGTTYDIKVVAQRLYGSKIYKNITTSISNSFNVIT